MTPIYSEVITPPCEWCSSGTTQVWHGGLCPRVKAIEYHPNGTIKRVEFVEDSR